MGRPARGRPVAGGAVVGVGAARRCGARPITGLGITRLGACRIGLGVPGSGLVDAGGNGLGDDRLLRRPRLTAFDRQLTRRLHRRLVAGRAVTPVVERGYPGTLDDTGEDLLQVLAGQCLLLEQVGGEHVESVAVLRQDRPRLGMCELDEPAHLVIDLAGHIGGVFGLGAHRPAEERIALVVAVAHRTQPGTHAVLGDHRTGDLGGLVDVARRTGGGFLEDQFLGGSSAHSHDQPRDHLRARHQVLVLFGHGQRVTAGASAGQDGDLVYGVEIGHRPRGQRVTALVVGDDLLLVFADDVTLAARPAHHPVDSLFERLGGDHGLVLTGGEQRGLVDDVGQVGTRHAGGAFGQSVQVGARVDRLTLGVHVEDGLAAGHVGVADGDLPVEAARTQQRRIEDVGPVGGGDQDDAGPVGEAVHLHQ